MLPLSHNRLGFLSTLTIGRQKIRYSYLSLLYKIVRTRYIQLCFEYFDFNSTTYFSKIILKIVKIEFFTFVFLFQTATTNE